MAPFPQRGGGRDGAGRGFVMLLIGMFFGGLIALNVRGLLFGSEVKVRTQTVEVHKSYPVEKKVVTEVIKEVIKEVPGKCEGEDTWGHLGHPATTLMQWDLMVEHHLAHWEKKSLTPHMMKVAEQRMVSTRTGVAFKVKIIDNRLYIKDIFALWFIRDYSPARVVFLLETLKRYNIPDLEVVFNQGDYPVMVNHNNRDKWTALYGDLGRPPPVFSPTASINSYDIPWPDFSWMPPAGPIKHELKTPRWPIAQKQVLEAASRHPWESKLALGAMTGNMQAEPRQRLVEVAKGNPNTLFVNQVFTKAAAGQNSCTELGLAQKGGFQLDKCGMSFEELCAFKYLINVGSNGYANKMKYLFLCNSVVLHVRYGSPNWEFFEPMFMPGVHYIAVPTVEDLPRVIAELQENDGMARRIAEAGTARMTALDLEEVTKYTSKVLTAYAGLMNFKPTVEPGVDVEINCEDDLYRHYNRDGYLLRWVNEDNSTCIHPPAPGQKLEGPGWGGAYNNSHVACASANDLVAVPDACDDDKRHPGDFLQVFQKPPKGKEFLG